MAMLWMILGLVLLIVGAEILVRGASRLARAVGIPGLIVGLTVVAFGTSAPELAVSVKAAIAGRADIALGNVVGSNTFNVLFILGLSALIVPLAVSAQLVRLDVPVMIGVSALCWVLALDGSIGRVEGVCLFAGICAYTGWLIVMGRRNPPAGAEGAGDEPPRRLGWSVLQVAAGLVLLVVGADRLVHGATVLAQWMGVSDLVIGLTVVAAGTSMPEVATSIAASVRGQRDIAVGNVVGSNIFNLLAVLGGAAAVSGGGVPVAAAALRFDVPVMMATALVCLPIFFTGGRISRWEGAVLLGYYAAYVAFVILASTRHAAMGTFGAAMLWFVLPLTVLGIVVSVAAWVRRRHRAEA